MPFTVAHVAAVLPLRARTRWAWLLPAAPLALGATAPDLPTAVGWPGLRAQTHTLAAALTTDAALAVVLGLLWVWLVRPAVADVVPGLAARWRPGPSSGRLVALRWYLAGAVGAVTHVAWDDVTHPGGFLDRWVGLGSRHGVFLLLQVASSVLGLAVLAWWSARWWRDRTPVVAPAHVVRWGHAAPALSVAALLAGAVAVARYLARQAAPVASAGEGSPLVEAAFGALSGLLLAALLLSLAHRLATSRRRVLRP
ncbi:hypothetical protein GCM10027446_24790 [Angustibacter peucedani]